MRNLKEGACIGSTQERLCAPRRDAKNKEMAIQIVFTQVEFVDVGAVSGIVLEV